MRKLLNTLYVTSENSYLSLDGENVVVLEEQKEVGRVPLHNLEGIVSFGYRGTSPALMGHVWKGTFLYVTLRHKESSWHAFLEE